MLYREPKLLKEPVASAAEAPYRVSVLYREPKLLKETKQLAIKIKKDVSVLYREPKLLKGGLVVERAFNLSGFSALP